MSRGPVSLFIRWSSRRALRWYYREVHYLGSERIPDTGAVLLFGNHPNDLPDVLAGFFTTRRPVRYVATISVATGFLARLIYRGLGVIPVTRVRDARRMRELGVEMESVNAAAFEAVAAAFAAGEVVGVFPEGSVQDVCKIGRPRVGVAKMALCGVDSGVIMVPFGVQYEEGAKVRSDVVVVVGEGWGVSGLTATTLSAEGLTATTLSANGLTATALTTQLHNYMLAVSRNSENWNDAGARDRLIASVAAVAAPHTVPLLAYSAMIQRACSGLVTETGAVEWRSLSDPIAIAVELAGGSKNSARDTARVLDAAGLFNPHAEWPSKMWMLFVALPAMLGLVLHWPIFTIVKLVARKTSVTRAEIAARAIIPGLHLILLWYLLLGVALVLGTRATADSPLWVIPAVMLLPRLGDVGLAWYDAWSALALKRRVNHWSADQRANIRATAERVHKAWSAVATLS